MVVIDYPFIDVLLEEKNEYIMSIRYFDQNVDNISLNWHMDKENRTIEILKGEEYYIQFENKIPIKLEKQKKYFINKEVWHRIIKRSKDDLTLLVKKWK